MLDHFLRLAAAERAIVIAYLVVMALLSIYGLQRYTLARAARRARRPMSPPLPSELPTVTIQLPIFNERYVVERLLESIAAIDWPHDRLAIQVLDDSTDGTIGVAAQMVEELRGRGLRIAHIHRRERSGFKAGALANGFATADSELIAIFDADFVPPPGILRALVGHFQDPTVGLVQARWEHLNRDASLLTRLQAVFLDGHFLIDQVARADQGRFFNFNGTAGIWRRAAIADAGGWQHDTLTEDLDLSYRAQLRGWRFIYRPDVVAPAELPADMNAYKSQQHRWAKGSAQAAVKLLPQLLRAPLPWRCRLDAFFHLTGNFTYPLVLALALLAYPVLDLRYRYGWTQTLFIDLPFLVLGTCSVIAFYRQPLARLQSPWQRPTMVLPLLALGIGMAINNSRAVIAGLVGHRSEFRRTPKRGDADPSADDARAITRGAYRPRVPGWVLAELALGVYFVTVFTLALRDRMYFSLPFLGLFAGGFLGTAIASIAARLHGSMVFSRANRVPMTATPGDR